MKILSFDTSTKFMSVACLEDDTLMAEFHEDVGMRHSEILVPTMKSLLEKIDRDIRKIDLFCVGLGPGSFTGLRIAAATVKGFALSMRAKVVGIPSMDAIAFNAPLGEGLVAPLLDAHKGKAYTCLYEVSAMGIKKKTDHSLVSVDDFLRGLDKEVFFFGDGVAKYKKNLDSSPNARYDEAVDWYPRASRLGLLGREKAAAGQFDDPETIEPLYLHPRECDVSEEVMRKIRENNSK